jgi:mono/diheme cytochrome c family protein
MSTPTRCRRRELSATIESFTNISREATVKRTGLWAGALVAIWSLAAPGAQDRQPERGEQIVTASCTGCHDLRPIDVQAEDGDGWTRTVNAEIAKGAAVQTEDVPILIDYQSPVSV